MFIRAVMKVSTLKRLVVKMLLFTSLVTYLRIFIIIIILYFRNLKQ